jgi:hypothetical protein
VRASCVHRPLARRNSGPSPPRTCVARRRSGPPTIRQFRLVRLGQPADDQTRCSRLCPVLPWIHSTSSSVIDGSGRARETDE